MRKIKVLFWPAENFCKALYEIDDWRKGWNECIRAIERELVEVDLIIKPKKKRKSK